jgi:hypothetical protein
MLRLTLLVAFLVVQFNTNLSALNLKNNGLDRGCGIVIGKALKVTSPWNGTTHSQSLNCSSPLYAA